MAVTLCCIPTVPPHFTYSLFSTKNSVLTETNIATNMALLCIVCCMLLINSIEGRPIQQTNSGRFRPVQADAESDASVLESTVFIVGVSAGIFGFVAISCAICLCVFLIGRHGAPHTLSVRTSRCKRDRPVLVPNQAFNEESPGEEYGERVSFMRTTISNDDSFRALEDLELEKIAIGPCLGRGAYGKVYRGEYAGVPLAIKVCEHDGAFLRNGNEPLEAYLSRNIHHQNVVKTLVNETRRCRGVLASMSELSPLNPPLTQRTQSAESQSSSTEGGSDEFSYIARTMGKSGGDDVYRTWIIMEYCEMGSLDQAIKERRFFKSENEPKFDEMILSAIDIAEATKYLHEQRIIHGDLKSQNVLLKQSSLDERGCYCKVGDFGLSRIIANKTHIDTFTCGTVSHSAPELFRRGLLTPAADVYSFGILLWELVSGTKAFNGAPHNGIVMAVTGGCRPIVPSYCPISLSRLINDCWQDSYRDRPTFKTISARLRDMLQNKTSLLTSPGTFSHPTSISLSATTSQDSNNIKQVQTDGVPRLEEAPSIDDSTMAFESDGGGMHLGRRVWTVPDLTELRSENDSSDDSSQSSAIADEQWHTASELMTRLGPSTPTKESSPSSVIT